MDEVVTRANALRASMLDSMLAKFKITLREEDTIELKKGNAKESINRDSA